MNPSTNFQRPSEWTDERLEVRDVSCPWDRELTLKTDEPQVGQRHEDYGKETGILSY